MNSFVSKFSNSLKDSKIEYKVVENVMDFRERRNLLEISKFYGETFSIARKSIPDLPESGPEIGGFVEEWLTSKLSLEQDSFELRISKDYVGDSVMDRVKEGYKWKSWFMLSSKYLNEAKYSFQGYIFLTVTKEKLYFVVFDEEGLKRLVYRKKIASNDRYHFYFGEANRWKFF
ncbi:TPA: hypothetical protein U1369_001569 [Streptococcus suis]|nr:hypothetical protein [Streptococcus suis]HEM5308931.1 hypothetical protein [Streptococcus suis]